MKLIACAWCLSVLGSSAVAIAEPNSAVGRPDAYQYVFTDDPLNAGLFGQDDARLVIFPRARRVTLIRPRTAFVAEMLKSVEAL
jgi:hypothetical protein